MSMSECRLAEEDHVEYVDASDEHSKGRHQDQLANILDGGLCGWHAIQAHEIKVEDRLENHVMNDGAHGVCPLYLDQAQDPMGRKIGKQAKTQLASRPLGAKSRKANQSSINFAPLGPENREASQSSMLS